jgi:hypothetical protein
VTSNWSNTLPTQLTVIDLHGNVLAAKKRADVFEVKAGPIGFAAICTANSVELVAGDLGTAKVISTYQNKMPVCGIDGLSPSRTAIGVHTYGDSPKSFARHRLFRAESSQPIAEEQLEKGRSLAGITDSGYAICTAVGYHTCAQLTVDGTAWRINSTEEPPRDNFFLSADELLLSPGRGDRALTSMSPDGKRSQAANLHGFQPPFVNSESVAISAVAPRRILYFATGCYFGDFDDCYGLFYHQFVVFDPHMNQPLFHHNANADSMPVISPNGHIVAALDKTKLHIYQIP